MELNQPEDEPKPGPQALTTHREAENQPEHWLTEQEAVGHDIIFPGRSTSCPTFFTQDTHTLARKWPLSTHTHTPGEITNTGSHTQAQTHMQGNGPH